MEKIENGKGMVLVERSKAFWEKHKKKIYIVGGMLVVCVGGYFLVKYLPCKTKAAVTCLAEKEEKEMLQLVTATVADVIEEIEPILERDMKEIPVSPCVVNLTGGRKASAWAKANAERAGVVLGANQTYRQGHPRTIAA